MNLTNCFKLNHTYFLRLDSKIGKVSDSYGTRYCEALIFPNNFIMNYSEDGSYERIYSLILGSTHVFPKWSKDL